MVPKGGLALKLHVIGGLQGSFFFLTLYPGGMELQILLTNQANSFSKDGSQVHIPDTPINDILMANLIANEHSCKVQDHLYGNTARPA